MSHPEKKFFFNAKHYFLVTIYIIEFFYKLLRNNLFFWSYVLHCNVNL